MKTSLCNCGAPLEPLFQSWAVTICTKRCGAEAGKGGDNIFLWVGLGPSLPVQFPVGGVYSFMLNTDDGREFCRKKWHNSYYRLTRLEGAFKKLGPVAGWGASSIGIQAQGDCTIYPIGEAFIIRSL